MTKLHYDHAHLSSLQYSKFEFGVPHWYGTFWHRVEDNKIALSYHGHRIAEVLPDDSVRLLLPSGRANVLASVKKRWSALFTPAIEFESTKRVKSTGLYEHAVKAKIRGPWNTNARGYPIISECAATASAALRVVVRDDETVDICNDDIIYKTAEVDKTKQREFNATLKKIRAVINSQISMGVYDSHGQTNSKGTLYFSSYTIGSIFRDAAKKALGMTEDQHFWYTQQGDMLYKLAQDWVTSGGPDLAKKFALVAFARHSSNSDGHDDLKQRVVNAMKYVQTRYLQEHCVKIEVSNKPLRPSNDDSNDQDRELLPPDGLREVQVSGEAQVC